ncbi:MAG: DUF1592 domain-containing protein [Opitutus sp.]|nr:DUF1592 domain-containing protein [Opitutus sp.]
MATRMKALITPRRSDPPATPAAEKKAGNPIGYSIRTSNRRSRPVLRRIFARERPSPKRWTVRSARGQVAAESRTRAERTSHPLSQSAQKSAVPPLRPARSARLPLVRRSALVGRPIMPTSENSGLIRRLVRALVRLYYPRIEVTGGRLIPRTGPVLLVANHPNSLIDPVLLGIAADRPVRLLAKAPLFKLPVFGTALRALGMVPAYRGSDDTKQVSKNLESLALAARQLAGGGVMGIFPEGKSHDATQLALVRSGVARLAMQAVAALASDAGPAGAHGLLVVPIGINYERKERFRSAVWIKVGRPIDAASWLRMHDSDEHRAMRALTQEIDARLRHCVTHLENPAWETLLDELEALLPPAPGGRRASLATLHRRKRAADAINFFHEADPPRAEAAAARVAAHAEALRAAGVPADARVFARRGLALAGALLRDGFFMVAGGAVGMVGVLHHLLPYGAVRLIAGRTTGPGRMVVALHRLLLSLPIYAAWYGFVGWRMSLYFLPWVTVTWLVSMPFAGLAAIAVARRLRTAGPLWWAEVRLLADRRQAARLRTEHEAVGRMLEEFATEARLPTTISAPPPTGVVYRPPRWLSLTLGVGLTAILIGLAGWLMRDRPIEMLRQGAPALHQAAIASLEERMASDERALVAVIGGLAALETRFRKFETGLATGDRSYYRPEDDDEIRRMLVSYLSLRTALLRTVWYYQRHDELPDNRVRLRALLIHYTAAAVAYDYAARFVVAFDGKAVAIKKLNEAEPRWDLPEGAYDAIRANLAHVAHRRWLADGWQNYHTTLPRWTELGLYDGEPHATFHRAIATAGENTAKLSEKLLHYKMQTAVADVKKFTRGGWYRASSAVSTLIGDTKIREPRTHGGLVTPELLAALRPRLRPGDIVIERRNWFLSNAFLPGYWPHAALYVGTADDLRALGLTDDPRVAKHLKTFSPPDAAEHRLAFIEAMSEGVVFTSAEHSIGEADSIAVLRSRLTPEQVKEVVARAFSHVGKPYDFDFDFFSGDKLVCTELVYRAFGSMVDFPLVQILGTKTLPAVEIVRFWASPSGAPQLEFVAFLDGDEITGKCVERDAAALKSSTTRPALTWFQSRYAADGVTTSTIAVVKASGSAYGCGSRSIENGFAYGFHRGPTHGKLRSPTRPRIFDVPLVWSHMKRRWHGPAILLGLASIAAAQTAAPMRATAAAMPPLLFQKYCFECHGEAKKPKAGLSLERLLVQASVGTHADDWDKVAEMLETAEMPPSDASLFPTAAERTAATSWVRTALKNYEREHGGEPGRVTVRRLTSGEYAYAIRDLTGLDLGGGIDASSDSVGGEGFTNFGDVQFVQDAGIERYLEAAKRVADHAVIGAGPLQFYSDSGKTGMELFALNRINELHTTRGFRVVSGEGGTPFGLDRYGKAFFAAWYFKHRAALGDARTTLRDVAAKEGLTAAFAEHVWSLVNRPSLGYPARDTVDRWRALAAPTADVRTSLAQARAGCDALNKQLTTWPSWFFGRGDVAAGGAGDESPLVFDDKSLAVEPTHAYTYPLGQRFGRGGRAAATTPGAPLKVVFNVSDINPLADAKPVVIWRNPHVITRSLPAGRRGDAAADVNANAAAAAGRRGPTGPILATISLRAALAPEAAAALKFGTSPDGSKVGEDDFATTDTVSFELPAPATGTTAELQVDAVLGADRNAVVRVVVADSEMVPTRGTRARVFLGDSASAGYRIFRAGVAEYAALLPPNSHGEANPADKDPVPAPFDSTFNTPEHDAFVNNVKYQRTDAFFTDKMVDGPDRERLNDAWNDLFGSWPYHNGYLNLLAEHYHLDLKGQRIDQMGPTQIANLPAEMRPHVTALRQHYEEVVKAQALAQPGHVEDALAFASRAWRRPLTATEQSRLRAFYQRSRTTNALDHDGAIRAVLARVLVSPAFLFRVETGADRAERPLDNWEMASRLSFFLWSSIPDDELRRAAEAGELTKPTVLAQQVRRMTADPKARRLAIEFFGQWLGFYRFDQFQGVDTGRFPEFTEEVKASMYDEAVSTFEHLVRHDRPVKEMLQADYTFLNQPLAKFYGIELDMKSTDRVVKVDGANTFNRGGALRLGAVLTTTSAPLRTSPVKRGDWLLRRILGTPTPPPPADAGSLPGDPQAFGGLTLRARLTEHKRNATCANCHLRIDPLGFPLEGFDAVGRTRTMYQDGLPVDVTGEFADQTTIVGTEGLLTYLQTKDAQVMKTLAKKMLGYALGRTVLASDRALIGELTAAGGNATFSDLATKIVGSRQFRNRQGQDAGAEGNRPSQ